MAQINISEKDFTTVADAAHEAKDSGDDESAAKLDKIARKINAALSKNAEGARICRIYGGGPPTPLTWRDVPSVFDRPKSP